VWWERAQLKREECDATYSIFKNYEKIK
jgi:hypothetical protein